MRMVMKKAISNPVAVRFETADGVHLATDVRGAEGSPTLLFAHGFGQTRQAWAPAAAALAERGCRCVCVDARGHGQSDRSPGGQYHMQQFFDDLSSLALAQPEPPILVGASMGGLLGLALAGEQRPAPFSALVLVDITPRWEGAGVERILGFMGAHPDGFADFDEAATAVAEYLPHRSGRKSRARLEPLLRRREDGRLHWHWDPAMLTPIAEEGDRYQARLLVAAGKVDVPVLLLSGERSDVVSADTIGEFMRLVPQAQHVEVAGATHMVAGDANEAFTHEIERFVQSVSVTDEAGKTGTRHA